MNEADDISPPIVCILAGGRARRMGGVDKATMEIGGKRLIDLVIARIAPQAGAIFISGPDDRRTGHACAPDATDGPQGPAAGLWSARRWLAANAPGADGFITVPVDAPFLPADLVTRLTASGATCVAEGADGLHPTIAHWRLANLDAAFAKLADEPAPALHRIAALCGAERVPFEVRALSNINTPDDIERAAQMREDLAPETDTTP